MILETLIPALIPVATDGIRAVFNRLTGGAGAKPSNVTEVITLMEAETKRLQALAEIDAAGPNVSTWVNNIRALQRPVASGLIITGYLSTFYIQADGAIVENLGQYALMVTFYLFGERGYMHMKKSR